MNLRLAFLPALTTIGLLAAARPAAAVEPVELGAEPQLVVDDALIAAKSGVTRRVHPCRKLPRPVLEPEKPWERKGIDQRIYLYGTVLRDDPGGLLRMWYNRGPLVMLATSADGLHWERPLLDLHDDQGSKDNNIVFSHFSSPSVIRDSREPDPAKRYKMLGSASGKTGTRHGYSAAYSADGLHWQLYPQNPVFPGGDTCTLAQDPRTGEYLAFHKRTLLHRGEKRRLVYLSASGDMQRWSEPSLVMAPDEIDDRQTRREGGRYSQFYNMSVFPCGAQFLGLVTHFRFTGPPAVKKGPSQSPDDGPIDVQLVHSRDGRHWYRCEDRSPVIPNGPYDYDAGCILGVANSPVAVGDQMWLYYTAITTTHGGYLPEKRITIALAAWRRDGFVSLDAEEEEGVVETVVLKPKSRFPDRLPLNPTRFPAERKANLETASKGTRLLVNADASAGRLAVEVLDAEGRPLAGYTAADCLPLTRDTLSGKVRWKTREELPPETPLRFRFVLRKVRLYSFCVD